MMTLISLLTFVSFADISHTSLDMKPVAFNIPTENIISIQPVLPKEVLRKAEMQIVATDDASPANQIELAEVSINEVIAYEFTVEGRPLVLEVKNQQIDECNSKIITAIDVEQTAVLQLIDNSHRTCKDFVDNTWTAHVKADGLSYELAGQPL